MTIRPLHAEQIPELLNILEETFIEMNSLGYYSPELIESYRTIYTPGSLVSRIADPALVILGASASDKLVGFLLGKKTAGPSLYIEWMAITAAYRRQ